MSFSFDKQGTKTVVAKAIADDKNLPASIKDYLNAALDAYPSDDQTVKLAAYGHLHNGKPDDYQRTNATIEVFATNELHPAFTNMTAAESVQDAQNKVELELDNAVALEKSTT